MTSREFGIRCFVEYVRAVESDPSAFPPDEVERVAAMRRALADLGEASDGVL